MKNLIGKKVVCSCPEYNNIQVVGTLAEYNKGCAFPFFCEEYIEGFTHCEEYKEPVNVEKCYYKDLKK